VDFEAQLASEGLSPIDGNGTKLFPERIGRYAKDPEAVDRYLAWAREVLRNTAFSSPYQRRVWELFSEGKSQAEIIEALKSDPPPGGRQEPTGRRATRRTVPSPHSVMMALRRVRSRAPMPPVDNPWGKRWSGRTASRGKSLETLVAKVMTRLRRISADPEELQQLLEAYTVEKNSTIRYSKILLDRQKPVQIPGLTVSKDTLQNIEGRPHAGGIDVLVNSEVIRGAKGRTRVTIPWHAIKQAEQDMGEAEAKTA
jgi:hypothetical protein